MNALKLASLISVTLTCLAPMSLAQSRTGTAAPGDGTTRIEPGDRVTHKEQKAAGIDGGATVVRPEPIDTVTYRKHPLGDIGEERTSERTQPGDIGPAMKLTMAREVSGALRLQVSPMDRKPVWIVVCFATEQGLVPVAALDAMDDAQTTLHLDLDEFGSLPLAMFALRFADGGYLEFSAVRTSAELANDAG